MRHSLCLVLLASFVVPRLAHADPCYKTDSNGVTTVLPCPSKIKLPPKDGDLPAPNLTVTGAPDLNTTFGNILGVHPPPAKQTGTPSSDDSTAGAPQGMPTQAEPTPDVNNGVPQPGAANSPARGVPASVPPAAAAKSGATAEQKALGSTGATANGLSVSAGDKFLLANKPADADRNYQRALAANPDDTAALTGHIQALGALGQKDEALSAARHLISLEPANPVAKGVIAQQHAEGATSKFKRMTDSFLHGPEGENLPDRPAGARATPGADQFASRPRADAGGAQPPSPSRRGGDEGLTFGPLLLQAQRKQAVGDYTGALIDVSQAIDSNPKDAAAWTLRAELDLQLSNYPAGMTDATRALDLGADNPRALRARAYAEYETRLYKQALADATRAVQLDPKSGLAYLYKAMAEEKLGLPDAENDLKVALALDPTLKRLAGPLLAKYALDAGAAPPERMLKPWMLRAGFVAAAMILVLIGLLGTQKARTLKAIKLTPRRARADDEPITTGDLAPGRMLGGGYRIVRELGRGGMGVVYEAFDERLRRTVAIKRLIRDELTTPEDTVRFLREARIVAQLKHANLAQIYDVADEREPFLVFEHVDGQTLDRVLSRAVVLTPSAARPLVAQISAALAYAHGRGVIHRDLKPSNVMVTADGAVKVMDFGIAHQSRGAATRLTQTVASGTPPYMAPEQAMGSVSKSSDLYALAVMTYELLTGKRPFEGPDFLNPKLEKRFTPPSKLNPALAAAMDHFFATALEADPTKRPADAAAFMEAFGRACDATPRRQPSAA